MSAYLEVVSPGLSTTVQDDGRFGWEALGISRGGAIDTFAYTWANRLVGNHPGEAALEALLRGPTFKPSVDVWIATTGVDYVFVDGRSQPSWASFPVPAGRLVDCQELQGARGYIAVGGGLDVPEVLGSRSTNIESAFGGYHGRRTWSGDRIRIRGSAAGSRTDRVAHPALPQIASHLEINAVMGPDFEAFSSEAVGTFLSSTYVMSPRSNHVGIRLDGPSVLTRSGKARVSQPMPVGGIQITPSGQPIILLNSRGTIGGYPLIGVVITPDLWKLGQLQPGQSLACAEVSFDKAVETTKAALRDLANIRPTPVS